MKLFFFGAGASKAAGLLLTSELAPAVYAPLSIVSSERLAANADVFEDFERQRIAAMRFLDDIRESAANDIDLLRKAFRVISQCREQHSGFRHYSHEDIVDVHDAIIGVFAILLNPAYARDFDATPYQRFAQWASRQDYWPVLVSTNWDGLLDSVVDAVYVDTMIDRGMIDLPVDKHLLSNIAAAGGQHGCSIFKLNGSVNWLYCPRHARFYGLGFQEPYNLETTVRRQDAAVRIALAGGLPSELPAQLVRGRCPKCGSRLEHRLYTPGLARTQLPIRPRMLRHLRYVTQHCDAITFIGFSCPDEDRDVMAIIGTSLRRNEHFAAGVTRPRIVDVPGSHVSEMCARYESVLGCNVDYDDQGFANWAATLEFDASSSAILEKALFRTHSLSILTSDDPAREVPCVRVRTIEPRRPETTRKAIQTLQRWEFLKDDPTSAFDPQALITSHNLAYLETDEGQFQSAEFRFKQVLHSFLDEVGFREALFETLEGCLLRDLPAADVGMLEHLDLKNQTVLFLRNLPWWPEVGVSCRSYGRNLHFQGRLAEAGILYRQAISIWKVIDHDHPNLVESMTSYGEILTAQGALAEAQVVLTEAANLIQGSTTTTESDIINYLLAGAEYMIARGELEHAGRTATNALAKCERAAGAVGAERGKALEQLGQIALEEGRPERALSLLTQAKEARASTLGDNHPLLASCETRIAQCYLETKDLQNARLSLDRAAALAGTEIDQGHPTAIDILCVHGDYLSHSRDHAAAGEVFERATNIVYETYGATHPYLAAIERLRSRQPPDVR